jgi:DNA polymerase III epsilon subunit-like protein
MTSLRPIAYLDVETTGLDPVRHEVIEVAILVETDRSRPPSEVFNHLRHVGARLDYRRGGLVEVTCKIHPEHLENADPEALKINGYASSLWKDALLWTVDLANAISDLLSRCLIVGQFVTFDLEMLKWTGLRIGGDNRLQKIAGRRSMDTRMLIYEHLTPLGLSSASLGPVCDLIGVSNEGAHHSLIDAYRCREVYHRLARARTLDRLKWWVKLRTVKKELAKKKHK